MNTNSAQPKPAFADRDISSTFVKGMAVLKAFDDTHTRLTLAEIAQITKLDRASVRRLTLTLVYLGYAEKDGRHFSLSPQVLILAGSFLRGNQFGTHIQPLLNRYSGRIGQTVSLAIPDGNSAVYVAQSTVQEDAVSFGFTVGSRLPLLHTAIGRMILAFAPPDWSEETIRNTTFEQYTPETTMDPDEILRRTNQCRTLGYTIVENEFEPGVTGFAVPVGGLHTLKAVVGTSKSTLSIRSEDDRLQTISLLQQVAQELGRSRMFSSS
ncbi:helix-turn-helix domain-containing protein [Puniceibacterium sp. HSS470]|nr:helix-turn-helix domain-containing protein [Puniceibacterium sp. HSS470]